MSPIQNFEQHSRPLVEPELQIQTRLQMAMEVRDSLEIAHTAEYLNFLKCYFRAFSVILLQITKPQFTDNPEHKLRNIVVEILNRLPHSEVLRPFVQDLLKVAMQVLTTDNEENGLICIRIIFDLLRNFRPTLETEPACSNQYSSLVAVDGCCHICSGPEKVPPHLKGHFIELKGAQVKTVSF
ncbi:hypothetical protein LWI28_002998 [Acer negundo]|uniref:Transformation/transcription domain-associated protein n=1 Tax=Acer negundo TaxID=4023 RepID=A0AAD5NGV8_ACENE|nr:hypothetical protein LWI28_002998 [Acer negundo]